MNPKSSGFTLIELLVVVAILGILGAIGTVTYKGYIDSSKKKSTENIMRQIMLAQTEYYSSNQMYYTGGSTAKNCAPSIDKSEDIQKNLFDNKEIILDSNYSKFEKANTGYLLCVADDPSNFKIVAQEQDNNTGNLDKNGCKISLTAGNERSYNNKC